MWKHNGETLLRFGVRGCFPKEVALKRDPKARGDRKE